MATIPHQCNICASFNIQESICKIYEQLPGEYGREDVTDCASFIERGSKESDDLKMILSYIEEDPTALEQSISAAVDRILQDYEMKYKVFIVGMARRKIKSIIKMVDIVDSVLDKLGQEELLSGMGPAQAIRLLSELNNSMNNDLTFIMKIVNPDTKLQDLQMWIDARTNINISGSSAATEDKAEEILRLSSGSREKVREAFESLLIQIKGDEEVEVLSQEDILDAE